MYLQQLYNHYSPTTRIILRVGHGRDTLMLVSADKRFPEKSIYGRIQSEWNKLPLSLRKEKDYSCFKQKLKTFLFNAAFRDM